MNENVQRHSSRPIFRVLIVFFIFVLIAIFIAVKGFKFRWQVVSPVSISKPSTDIVNLQNGVEGIVSTYQPVVVNVVATQDVPVIKKCTVTPFFGGFGLRPQCTYQNQKVQTSGGTGFVIDPNGIILTNKHVVEQENAEYTVLFNDGKEDKVTSIYRDVNNDIAVLKINRQLNYVAKLGDSSGLKVGQFVVAMGNVLGEFKNSASFGIVSGLDRSITAESQQNGNVEQLQKVIQTDAAINSGNSGGPLININGEVIGMNTARASQGENVSFAIPINDIKPVIEKYIH